ncbi:hypothetical protein B0H19DRAFT_1258805 [Mycena capillaripes]|nr:hypothetical protein B0H19DRAFT_1258805 [Mycena capillaripes]
MTVAHGDSDSDSLRRLKTELLIQMDDSEYNDAGGLVIGATKIHWQMNSIERTIQRRTYFSPPECRDPSVHIIRSPLQPVTVRTQPVFRAEVAIVVQDTPMQPMRKFIPATHFNPVPSTADDEHVE